MKKQAFYLALMLSGGAIGGYSLLLCGVFANIQTGNLIKLFLNLVNGFNFEVIMQCLLPILGFLLGVFYVKLIEKTKYMAQIALITEALLLLSSAFIPNGFWLNIVRSVILSFCSGIQLQAFHLLDGKFFATTMCTNNMRSVVDLAFDGIVQKDKKKLTKAAKVAMFVAAFCVGAVVSAILYKLIGSWAILIDLLFLAVAYFTIEK